MDVERGGGEELTVLPPVPRDHGGTGCRGTEVCRRRRAPQKGGVPGVVAQQRHAAAVDVVVMITPLALGHGGAVGVHELHVAVRGVQVVDGGEVVHPGQHGLLAQAVEAEIPARGTLGAGSPPARG